MSLPWTGERLVTTVLNEIAIEHLARYALASNYVSDKYILDAACGEGYGSFLLSKYAKQVIGLDIDQSTISHATKKYKKENLRFVCAPVTSIPLSNESIDVIVSFETIEHLTEQEEMLLEFKRVLKKEGIVIISTPIKQDHQLATNNPFHKKELSVQEFKLLLCSVFNTVKILNQKMFYGSLIVPEGRRPFPFYEYAGNFESVTQQTELNGYAYCIALCSLQLSPTSCTIVFSSEEILEKQRESVAHLKNTLSFKVGRAVTFPFRKIRDFLKTLK